MPTKFSEADYLTGRVRVPPWFQALKQKPYSYTGQITVAANSQGVVALPIQADSYFLAESLSVITPTETFEDALIQIQDTTTGQPWSNLPIPIRDIAGRGDNPFYFCVPNFLRPSSSINLTITNGTGSAVVFYVTLSGQKVYGLTDAQVAFLTRRMFFEYKLILPAITSGSTNVQSVVNIFNESDFLLKKIWGSQIHNFVINTAVALAGVKEVLVNLRDLTSDNNFFSAQANARSISGAMFTPYLAGGNSFTNGRGYEYKRPFLIRRNGQIQGTWSNQSGTAISADTLAMTFEGVRIFDPS